MHRNYSKQLFVVVVAWFVLAPVTLPAADAPATAPAANPAVTPVPRTNDWWVKRMEEVNARVKEGNVDLIFVGDSITQGWGTNGKDVWAKYYAGRNAVNLGFSGDRTQHVLWRLENGNIAGLKPKAAVVMIGTNNCNKDGCPEEEIADGIAAVVGKLRTMLPDTKVLLLAVFPRGETPNDLREHLAAASELAAKRVADGKMVHYLDIGRHLLADDQTISKDIMPDFLHLTPAGYAIWAKQMEPKLAELLGERPIEPEPAAAAPPAAPPPDKAAKKDGDGR